MKTRGIIVLLLFGLTFWVLGTFWYRTCGQAIFETTSLRYWLNFVLTPVMSTVACVGIFRRLGIPAAGWSSAALLIAIPGMIGEAIVVSNFPFFMPRMATATAETYSGFLFAVYALVLGVAETVTLRAR